jgi:hypothetical protein
LRSKDPKRIKFNHALHLAPGLTLEKDGAKFVFGRLSQADRIRYGGADEKRTGEPIKLECASCHSPEPAEQPRSADHRLADAGPPRPEGLYMAPIVYENHCAACHPLQFEEKRPEQFARHGVSAQETLNDLKQLYMSEARETLNCFGSSFPRGRCLVNRRHERSRLSVRPWMRRC